MYLLYLANLSSRSGCLEYQFAKAVTIYCLFYPNTKNMCHFRCQENLLKFISGVTHLAAIRNNHAINSSFPQSVIFFGLYPNNTTVSSAENLD